jgi:DNA-binding MarR family transcriptional regulator
MVDRLVAAGLIDRFPHRTSRRELLVALTKHRREVVRRVTAYPRADIAPAWRRCRPRSATG